LQILEECAHRRPGIRAEPNCRYTLLVPLDAAIALLVH
jgi:hypothetical protein